MPSAGFESAVITINRLQTYALDRTATEISGFEPSISAIEWLQTYTLDRTVSEISGPYYKVYSKI
jgi:hypothetical protein